MDQNMKIRNALDALREAKDMFNELGVEGYDNLIEKRSTMLRLQLIRNAKAKKDAQK